MTQIDQEESNNRVNQTESNKESDYQQVASVKSKRTSFRRSQNNKTQKSTKSGDFGLFENQSESNLKDYELLLNIENEDQLVVPKGKSNLMLNTSWVIFWIVLFPFLDFKSSIRALKQSNNFFFYFIHKESNNLFLNLKIKCWKTRWYLGLC